MKHLILLFLTSVFISKALAQGCSDAGFCTMQHLNVDAKNEKDTVLRNNDFSIGFALGIGDDYNLISNPYLTYSHDFSRRLSLSSKIASSIISGNKGNVAGLGDLYITPSYKIFDQAKQQTTLLAGFKLPLNNSNLNDKGQALPLSYQTSLGSIDAILGINVSVKHFDLNAGAQIPLKQFSKNSFFSTGADTADFASTNLFRRKSDVLLRTTYHFFSKQKVWKFSAGILGIYHLGNDTYVNYFGNRQVIPHSDGLTLNAVLAAHHYFKSKNYITFSLGAPFVVREIRPDGLTRAFVTSFEYHFQF